jgi:hypothetical protein
MIHLPQGFGVADVGGNYGNRRIYVICMFSASGASAVTLNSATIGGVTATMFTGFSSPDSATPGYRVFAAYYPAQISADIGLVFSGTILASGVIYLCQVNNQRTALAAAENDVDSLATASGTSLARTMTNVENGFSLFGLGLTTNVTSSVTNAVRIANGANPKHGAWDYPVVAGNTTYTWTWTGAQAAKMFASSF